MKRLPWVEKLEYRQTETFSLNLSIAIGLLFQPRWATVLQPCAIINDQIRFILEVQWGDTLRCVRLRFVKWENWLVHWLVLRNIGSLAALVPLPGFRAIEEVERLKQPVSMASYPKQTNMLWLLTHARKVNKMTSVSHVSLSKIHLKHRLIRGFWSLNIMIPLKK